MITLQRVAERSLRLSRIYRELEQDARDRGEEDLADFFGEIQAQEVRRYFQARSLDKARERQEAFARSRDFELEAG